MAKSAINKLLTEILYDIEKLIYIRFIDKQWIKNILLNSYASAKLCQTLRFLKGNQDTSRAPNNNKQPFSCQTSLRNLLFHLVQRISHFKSTDLYLFCTTKVFPKFPLSFQSQASFQSEQFAMTMQHGRCHWSRAVWQVSGRACSCKKDPCYFWLTWKLSPLKPPVRLKSKLNKLLGLMI